MRRKDFWLLSTVNKVLKEFIPKLSHEADGLIFQVIEEGYRIIDLKSFELIQLFLLLLCMKVFQLVI